MRISDWSSDVCSSDLLADHQCVLPVAERSVLLERRHPGEDAAGMDEARRAPLDGLLHVRAGFVYQISHVFEYRARQRRRHGDVSIHTRIAPAHRSTPPAWRLRPGAEVAGHSHEAPHLAPGPHKPQP